jgi:tetratricopeptide (TPR) repeat protein
LNWKVPTRPDGFQAAGNPEEALTVLRGIPQGAVDGDVLLSAGKAPYQTGQYDLSVVYYERALSSDDENGDTYFRLGTALLVAGRVGDSLKSLKRAVELNSSNVRAYRNLATALAETGDTESEKATYREVLRLDSTAQDREEDERWIKEH